MNHMTVPVNYPLTILVLTLALCLAGCGDDDDGGTANNSGTNNGSTTNNGGTNNGGTNNGGTNNGGTNNGTTNNGGTNNGTTNNGGTNNGTTNNGGTNNGTTNNGGTNNGGGNIVVSATIRPNVGQVGDQIEIEFTTLEGIEFDETAIGGDNMPGHGHYHVYLDQVDEQYELLVSGTNPDTFMLTLEGIEIMPGAHQIIVTVHRNDHTEFTDPIEFSIDFTVNE